MAKKFFVRIQDRIAGPFSSIQIKAAAQAGKLKPNHELSESDAGPWMSAGKVRGLFAELDPGKTRQPAVTVTVKEGATKLSSAAVAASPPPPSDSAESRDYSVLPEEPIITAALVEPEWNLGEVDKNGLLPGSSGPIRNGFVEKHLVQNERVLFWSGISPVIFLLPGILFICAAVIAYQTFQTMVTVENIKQGMSQMERYSGQPRQNSLNRDPALRQTLNQQTRRLVIVLICGLLLLASPILLILNLIRYLQTEYALTNLRIIMKTGSITSTTFAKPYHQIAGIELVKLSLGKLCVYPSGEATPVTFPCLKSPQLFCKYAQRPHMRTFQEYALDPSAIRPRHPLAGSPGGGSSSFSSPTSQAKSPAGFSIKSPFYLLFGFLAIFIGGVLSLWVLLLAFTGLPMDILQIGTALAFFATIIAVGFKWLKKGLGK
ncbi:MAG: hypothetical protein SFX18_18700 [Pirellulales bacterium]|nr:hypothetical protein [Pirellulales bacterium]